MLLCRGRILGVVLAQGRMQRCLVRCQDVAKDSMPTSPSEKDIRKAQARPSCSAHAFLAVVSSVLLLPYKIDCMQGTLAGCYATCAEEYERQLPKLGQDVRAQLKRALQQ